MSSLGQSLLGWVAAMNLATAAVLLAALLADRLLQRRVAASARLILYLAVLARLFLPAGWQSPLGLLGLPAPTAAWEPTATVDLAGASFQAVDAGAVSVFPGALVLSLWAGVSLLLLGWWIACRLALRRQLRSASAAGTTDSGVPVLRHPELGPLVAGLWRPCIVIPAGLLDAADGEPLRWVLRHESAHAQRRDPLLSGLLQLGCLLAWPVLPLWIAAHRVRLLMEIACDERAVARVDGRARRRYAEVLLALAQGAPSRSPLAAALSFTSPLPGRLRALVPRRRWPALLQAAVVGGLAALAVACAGEPDGTEPMAVDAGAADAPDAPVVTLAADGSAWLHTRPGGSRRLYDKEGDVPESAVPGYLGLGLVPELRKALAETGARQVMLRGDKRVGMDGVASFLRAARAAAATEQDMALPSQERADHRGLRPRPPILTVTSEGRLLLEGHPVSADQLEARLRSALTLRGQDTLLIRGDRADLHASKIDVMSAAKRAGASRIGILAGEEAESATPTSSAPTGTLDPKRVHERMRANIGEVRRCYEAALAEQPDLRGRLDLRFVIASDGRVAEANVAHSTVGSPAVERCLLEAARGWRFPRPTGGSVEVSYPFVFSSRNAP